MSKWADCLVSAVRYDDTYVRIDIVQARCEKGKKIGSPIYINRRDFISTLKHGKTAITIYKENDKWKKGARISIMTVDGEEFIRTDGNNIKEDNLGEIEGF